MERQQPPITLDEAVLLAIAEGDSSISAIASRLNVDRNAVMESVSRLHARGLIRVEESGFFIFRSKKLVLTERGFQEVARVKEKLGRWIESLGSERDAVLRDLATDYGFLLPVLYLLGFMALTDLYSGLDQPVDEGGGEEPGFDDFDADVDVA